ncbi:MAG: hypothetical protein JWN34_5647 [Bryobacterales bacterium]|nr:hypothetical protein [Bryobacterales bacterium]
MLLWRVSRHRDLSGRGGLTVSARWHRKGAPVVYLAECPPGALLEVCVHTSADDIPQRYTLLEVSAADSVAIDAVDESRLPKDWMGRVETTRQIGTEWLASSRTALLRIPSALVPRTTNVMLNPLHADARRIKVTAIWDYPFDQRLKS